MQTIKLDKLKLQSTDTVLDLGCGEGRHSHAVAWQTPAPLVVGVDISEHDVSTARARHLQCPPPHTQPLCYFTVADGKQLPFADNSFSVVICSEVLEHIPHYRTMLNEIARVLKPGGQLALSVPRAWPEKICWQLSRAYYQVDGGHLRIFKIDKLRAEVEQRSLLYRERHWAHALHTPYWWLRCLFWREHQQVAVVRGYHRLLVWDLMQKPWLTRAAEACLNPLLGKSVVMYFVKELN